MPRQPKLLDALVVIVLFVVSSIYIVITLSTNDPAWVVPRFSGQASKMVLFRQGQITEIVPGSPGYEALNSLLNQALSRVAGFHESLGLSPETMAEYRTKAVVLEVFYPQPVVVHSRFSFGRPNTLLIPLEGRHSESRVVFGGLNSDYWAGALVLRDLRPLKEKLAELGY